jgi:hypothetical protein
MMEVVAPSCCPIIVLGAERSGTSVVTQMVHRWGAYAGEPGELTQADTRNPEGYWEYTAIWDFLVGLGDLKEGASWWDATFQARVREKLSIPSHRAKALGLVGAMEKAGKPWVWKDPALSFFLPFWKEIWGSAVYIILVRNPYDVARSWQQFVLPPQLAGSVSLVAGNLLRWQYITLLILEHTEEIESKIFVSYEELVQDPRQQAGRLCAFLDRHCEVEASGETQIARMAEAVDPKLWHNQSQRPFSQVREATDAQKALYGFIERKIKDPLEKFERARYPMPPGWREFVKNKEALVRAHAHGGDVYVRRE